MKRFVVIVCSLLFIAISAAEKPLLRAGLITDTHVTPDIKSVEKLRAAFELFKRERVDMVINLGDVADKFHPQAYRHYRNTVKSVYPDGIREIIAYANHDQVSAVKNLASPVPYPMLKAALEISHDPEALEVVNGFPFVIFSQQFKSLELYEQHLSDAAKKFPGRPLFVIEHRPPCYSTFCDSGIDGKVKILEKFPQIIHLSGHIHGDIRNERLFWQGAYTAVNLGCLKGWGGALEGTIPFYKRSSGVLIMEVYKNKVIFRRMDCLLNRTVAEPWIVALPYQPQEPQKVFEERKKASVTPQFPAGSKIRLSADKPFNELKISFSAALPQKDVYKYEIFIKDKVDGKLLNRQEIFGDFYRDDPVKNCGHTISAGYFESQKEYIIEVIPFNFFGKRGNALRGSFKAPDKLKWQTVFECREPMKTLKFREGLENGRDMKLKNGFYIHDVENARLIFPENAWSGKAGSRYRFTIDMHTRQSGIRKWTLVLRNTACVSNARPRLYTQNGDLGVRRYVIEFVKPADDYSYYLLIREGDMGEIRFDYVKIERLD